MSLKDFQVVCKLGTIIITKARVLTLLSTKSSGNPINKCMHSRK